MKHILGVLCGGRGAVFLLITFDLFSSGEEMLETALQLTCFMSEIVSACPTLLDSAHPTTNILEFLPEGPGTGFLHKKRVPGGLLSAPADSLAKDPSSPFWLRPQAAACKKEPLGSLAEPNKQSIVRKFGGFHGSLVGRTECSQ